MPIGPGPEVQWRASNAVEQWWLGVMQQQNRLDLPDLDPPDVEQSEYLDPAVVQRLGRQVSAQAVGLHLYVEALWRFRKAVLFAIHHVEGGADLVPALDAFDAQVSDLDALHDVTAAFDEYLIHGGRFRRGEQGLVMSSAIRPDGRRAAQRWCRDRLGDLLAPEQRRDARGPGAVRDDCGVPSSDALGEPPFRGRARALAPKRWPPS